MSLQQQLQPPEYPKIVDVTQDDKGVYVKAFLIDDSINQNFWHIPDKDLERQVYGFVNRPLIKHPEGKHIPFLKEGVKDNTDTFIDDILRHQESYRIGNIEKVTKEPMKDNPHKNAYFAYIRLTRPEALGNLKGGASNILVSPLIYDEDQRPVGQPTNNFIPIHLAVVDEPAYGNKANIKGVCNGSGKVCLNSLKEAALKLVSEIDNSSYFKKSDNNDHNLTQPQNNQNQVLDQVQANSAFNPNMQYSYAPNGNPQQGINQVVSEKKEVREVDAQGNEITKVEDKKKTGRGSEPISQPNPASMTANVNTNPNQIPAQQNVIPNPQNPQAPQQYNDFQLPKELLDKLNSIEILQKQVEDLSKYKQTEEEKRLKEASEAQRSFIEQSFSHVQDPNAKQQIVDYLVGLNLQDQDLQTIIQAIVTGQFSAQSNPDQQAPASAQPAQATSGITSRGSGFPKKQSAIKGAAIAETTLRLSDISSQSGYTPNNSNVKIFSDDSIDWERLL